jgi:phospholipid/cholesterol/gamma-HCH transport system permease protein
MAECMAGLPLALNFIDGAQRDFILSIFAYAFLSKLSYSPLLLATIPSFHGYYMKGGALEVGKSEHRSFVWTSVCIILLIIY